MVEETFKELKEFFKAGNTLPLSFRINQLKKLKESIKKNEAEILEALNLDLGKSPYEAYSSEILLVYQELDYHLKHVKSWSRKKRVASSLLNFPSKNYVISYPRGTTLILSPWNYPFLLSISPLIGAISAGNTILLKPSEFSPNSSEIIAKILKDIYDPTYINVLLGDATLAAKLSSLAWDKIFFTGSTATGRKVYEAAAKNLVPVTLELGGKSPCIILDDAPIKESIERIFLGKFFNAGQTCISPDHIWISSNKKDDFIKEFNAFSEEESKKGKMCTIINEKHEDRLQSYLQNDEKLPKYPKAYAIEDLNEHVKEEEIFGPILPVHSYESIEKLINKLQINPSPLSFYIFTKDRKRADNILKNLHFGGAVINDVLLQIINNKLPFGGVGASGIGNYHGKYSFDCFSYKRPIVYKFGWKNLSLKKLPFNSKKLKLLRKINKWLYNQ